VTDMEVKVNTRGLACEQALLNIMNVILINKGRIPMHLRDIIIDIYTATVHA
jgi:hypothetical protein